MITVDPAAMATELGVTETQVNVAIGQLEQKLGYPLLGTTDNVERVFSWTPTLWHRVNPFYAAPSSVVLVAGSDEETLSLPDLQYGQNGQLFGDWFNAFKLCESCIARCRCYDTCRSVRVTAKWGFAAPDDGKAVIPGDLYGLLTDVIKWNTDDNRDIQSENTGTRSYSRFTKAYETPWAANAELLDNYKMRDPRHN